MYIRMKSDLLDLWIVTDYKATCEQNGTELPNPTSSVARIICYWDFLNSKAWRDAKNTFFNSAKKTLPSQSQDEADEEQAWKIRELQIVLEECFFPDIDIENFELIKKARWSIASLWKKEYWEVRIVALKFLESFENILGLEKTVPIKPQKILKREKLTERHKAINREIWDIARHSQNVDQYIVEVEKLIAWETTPLYISNYITSIYLLSRFKWQKFDSALLRESLMEIVQKVSKDKSDINCQEIWNALYGLQWLDSSVVTREFLEILWKKIAQGWELDGQGIWNALYWLVGLQDIVHARQLSEILFQKIELYTERELELLGYINIQSLVQQYSFYKRNAPRQILEKFQESTKNIAKNISYSEQKLLEKIREVFPNALSWKFIGGFETDIYIPELEINIESDGLHHSWNKIFRDTRRDICLKENFGITTLRFSVPNHELSEEQEYNFRVQSLIRWIQTLSCSTIEK